MYKSKKQFFRVVLSRLAFVAMACLPWGWSVAAQADNPWYLEASYSHTDFSGNLSGFDFYDTDSGWSLGFGYAFNPYISVQATYHALASDYRVDDCPRLYICLVENVDQVDVTGVSVSALFGWPITDMFDVFGEVGVISWDADFQTLNHDESDEEFMYGAGLGVNFSDHWRMVMRYQQFDFDAGTASLGLVYKF
jgi:OOP family OmpA-OmpF porin